MPAFLEAWRAGLLRRDNIIGNIVAGAVVGVVAIPLAMAFAVASGAKPEQGLYTALVAGILVTLFGGTRVQIAGPTGAFAVLLFGVVAKHGFAGLQIVTLMAGVMLVAFGLARLGSVIRFIPESVILGFTAGIAVVIWVGQWANFFGLPEVAAETFLERLIALAGALPRLQPATTLLGVASVLVIVLWPRIPVLREVPGPLVALVAGTAYVAFAHPAGIATIGSAFGGIPAGLPPLTLPHASLATVTSLIQPAFAIALLGAIESLLSATVADGMAGTRPDANQELLGQGIANLGAALFGGFAATGAIARTATNLRHGGNSPVAGIAHAGVIVLVLVALAPLAAFVPLATLAAILFVVAFNMSDMGRVVRVIRRAPRSDVAVMLVTLGLTVFADLVIAVEVGVILAMLNFFRRMTAAVKVRALEDDELAEHLPEAAAPALPPGVLVYTIDGPFFFGAVEQFESALLHTGTDPKAVILSLARVPFIDLTGMVALRDAVERLEKRGVRVALCCASEDVSDRLEKAALSGTEDLPASAGLADALARIGTGARGTP
ncbi:MAG TPA: SulP family inorganic anion transporter [Coriobacteriia bacterium]